MTLHETIARIPNRQRDVVVTTRADREFQNVPNGAVQPFQRLLEKLVTGAENVRIRKIRDGRLRELYSTDSPLYTARASQRDRLVFGLDGDRLTIHGFRDRGDKQCYASE